MCADVQTGLHLPEDRFFWVVAQHYDVTTKETLLTFGINGLNEFSFIRG